MFFGGRAVVCTVGENVEQAVEGTLWAKRGATSHPVVPMAQYPIATVPDGDGRPIAQPHDGREAHELAREHGSQAASHNRRDFH